MLPGKYPAPMCPGPLPTVIRHQDNVDPDDPPNNPPIISIGAGEAEIYPIKVSPATPLING